LLIIRDPLVILIYAVALATGQFPNTRFLRSLGGIALLAALAGVMAAQFDPKVYLFGFRSDFLHLPLIFVIPRVMGYEQVVKMGKWILILAVPMAYLVVRQFAASPDDVLNIGVGVSGRQIASAGGKVRASGTFSFVTGIVAFYSMVAAFLLHGMIKRGTYPLWLQLAGTAGLVAAVATSGSRSALASVVLVGAGLPVLALKRPQLLGRILVVVVSLVLIGGTLMQFGTVEEGVQNLTTRFEEAGGHAGIWPRVAESFTNPFYQAFQTPLFGYGLGVGTNAGSALLIGRTEFLLAEDEWSRVIMESGPFVGTLFIIWRVAFVVWLFRVTIKVLHQQNPLPLLLLSSCGFLLLGGQFGQPTTLGFAALGCGICLAAARTKNLRLRAFKAAMGTAASNSSGVVVPAHLSSV
jgi:hypothetical protein